MWCGGEELVEDELLLGFTERIEFLLKCQFLFEGESVEQDIRVISALWKCNRDSLSDKRLLFSLPGTL